MSITRVQGAAIHSAGGVTSQAITVSSGVMLGNLVVATVMAGNTVATITGPAGWTQATINQPPAGTDPETSIWYLVVGVTQAGQTSFTFTLSSAISAGITIEEWSSSSGWQASPLDRTATGNATSTTATTITSGTTATTTQAEELWIASLAYQNAAQTESGITAGWTKDVEATATGNTVTMLYNVVSSTGVASCQYTIGTAEFWAGAVATFMPKPALSTSPTSLSFSDLVGGSSPASQNSTLSETAGAGTAWTSAISYGTGSGWLAISPTSGTLGALGTQPVSFTCTTGLLASGTYSATVTFTATTGGSTATVAVTFVVSAPFAPLSGTALSVYGTSVASVTLTTAGQCATASGGTETSTATLVGAALKYGEMTALGTASVWPALTGPIGSIAPDGKGWLLDSTVLEGQTIASGTWSAAATVRYGGTSGKAFVADFYMRAYRYDAGAHTYTLLGTFSLTAQNLGSNNKVTLTFPTLSLSAAAFTTGQKLYIDLWPNITSNGNGTSANSFTYEGSAASAGVINDIQIGTPGYSPTSSSPVLATSPTSLSFAATVGGSNPATQNSTLSETAGFATAWTSSITYGSGSGWLAISPTSGSLGAFGSQSVVFTCTTGALVAGTYTATVTYTATTGGSTATVSVTFTVTSPPVLATSPSSLAFTAVVGGANPVSQNDTLSNTGGTSTAWTSAIAYGSGSGWLAIAPTSGTLGAGTNVTVAFSCTTGTLVAGTYTATVTFTAGTGGSTATVSVTFTVTPPPVGTALALYGTSVAAVTLTTAGQLATTAGGAETTTSTLVGNALGYGEMAALGNASAWLASTGPLGSIAPDGKGWLLDSTVLVGQTIAAGVWNAEYTPRYGSTSGQVFTADFNVRIYRYDGGAHTYTLLGTFTLTAQNLGSNNKITLAFPNLSLPAAAFATGQKLYVDVYPNITSNGMGSSANGFSYLGNAAANGVTGDLQISTPGYGPTATPTLATSPSTLTFRATVGGGNPTNQNSTLSETAGAGTAWTSAITYGSGSGWLTVSPTAGTLAAFGTQSLLFQVTTGALTAGTYTATFTATATTGGSQASVSVTFIVAPAQTLTITIGNSQVIFDEDTLLMSPRLGQTSQATFTVLDYAGNQFYQYGEQVTIVDSVLGTRYSGVVVDDKQDKSKTYGSPAIEHQITCNDNRYYAAKRTSNRLYSTPTYAGKIAVDMATILSAEGISASYGLHEDNSQAGFAQGFLNGVVATNNVVPGDLELALAGVTVSHTDHTNADWSSGTLNSVVASNNTLILKNRLGIALVGDNNGNQGNPAYIYWCIWQNNDAPYTIQSGDLLTYKMWINGASPTITSGMDFICTDGTMLSTYRTGSPLHYLGDQNAVSSPPAFSTKGFADNQWYYRYIDIGSAQAGLAGKQIATFAVAFESSSAGHYAAYFFDCKITDSSGTVTHLGIYNNDGNLQSSFPLRDIGYNHVTVTTPLVYDTPGTRVSPAINLNSVGIANTSLVTFTDVVPTTPTATTLVINTSLDGGATWQACTTHAAIPGLIVGASLSGMSLLTQQVMTITGNDPIVTPVLSSLFTQVTPSYAGTKHDLFQSAQTQSQWNNLGSGAGGLSIGNQLTITGQRRNWDDGSLANQTLYGNASPVQGANNRRMFVQTNSGTDVRSRMDWAGNTWQNFRLDVDVQIPHAAGDSVGVEYWTTNWGNGNNSGAWHIDLSQTVIQIGYGANNGSNSTQGFTVKQTFSGGGFAPVADSVHTLTVIVSGGNTHKVYLDGVRYINLVDGTYSGQGYVALRGYNTSGSNASYFFDNFGINSNITSGTYTTNTFSLAPQSVVGDSFIAWRTETIPPACTLLVQASLNGGSTYIPCVNGAEIPGLAPGVDCSNMHLIIQALLTTSSLAYTPTVDGLMFTVTGSFSSTGTRTTVPLGNDTFVRGNVSGSWGTSFDGQSYTRTGTGTVALSSNEGTIAATTGDVHMQLGNNTTTDIEGTVRLQISASGTVAGIELRYGSSTSYYRLNMGVNLLSIMKNIGSGNTTLASSTPTIAAGSYYRLRFRIVGTTLYGRVWADATLEPGLWNVTVTDTSIASGGLALFANGAGTASFDHLRVTQYPDPALSLAQVLPRAGATLVAWQATTPANTSVGMALSTDGVNFTDVTSGNGQPFPFVFGQPNPVVDAFATNTGSNYTSTFKTGGSVASYTWDTANSRLIATGGSNALLLNTTVSHKDMATLVFDMDTADDGGLAWDVVDTGDFYQVTVRDSLSSVGTPNRIVLQKVTSGTVSQLVAPVSINFVRGILHRFQVSILAGVITVSMDGVQLISYTDGSPLGAGQAGLRSNGGTQRYYSLWLTPAGDYVSGNPAGDTTTGMFVYTKATLSSTSPTVTPQLLDLYTVGYGPTIGSGTLMPSANYQYTFVDKNLNDAAKQSNYDWWIDPNLIFYFTGRQGLPAPWILSSNVLQLPSDVELDSNLLPEVLNDQYRNRQVLKGVTYTIVVPAQQFIGDTVSTSFTLGYPVAGTTVPPTITLNGQPQTVGLKGTTGYQWYYAPADPVIVQDASGVVLIQTDLLVVGFTGTYIGTLIVDNVTAQQQLASIEHGTGIVEDVQDVSSPGMLLSAAQTFANQLLARYCITGGGRTYVGSTYHDGLVIGQALSINIPEENLINSQQQIQQIDMTVKTQPNGTLLYKYLVTSSELPTIVSYASMLASALA